MRHRIAITHLDHAETGGCGQKAGPTHLKKIEMVGLGLTEESARQNESRRHAVAHQRFEARWYAAAREIDPRAAVQCIEPISGAGPDAASSVSKQRSAALIGAKGGERLGLRVPLPGSRGIKVDPPAEWSSDLQTISSEPAKLVGLLHQSPAGRRRQVRRRERGAGVRRR